MCEPDNGIPFISLSWAGMAGVVSGMNRAGVSVTVNGAPSSLPERNRDAGGDRGARNFGTGAQSRRSAEHFARAQKFLSRRSGSSAVAPTENLSSSKKLPTPRRCASQTAIRSSARIIFKPPVCTMIRATQITSLEATSVSREARLTELMPATNGAINVERAAGLFARPRSARRHFRRATAIARR